MEKTTAAWLAALIDGEGSIMLIKRSPSKNAAKKIPALKNKIHYRVMVSICNTDVRLIEAIKNKTGISRTYEHKRPEHKNHAKRVFTWRATSSDCVKILPEVMPWLVIKKEQAELLLEAIEIKKRLACIRGQKRIPIKEREQCVERLHEIYSEIRSLNTKNRKGGHNASS